MSDDFYQYGRVLGAYQAGVIRAMERIAAGIRDARRAAQAERTDPLVAYERSRERVYRARIEAERAAGRRYVRQAAQQARRNLGLEDR